MVESTFSTTSILDILAPELIHEIISFLPLSSLLLIRSVCCTFQEIVLSSTRISRPRASLIKLYLSIVNSPTFLQTRPWTLANLTQFDRPAYIKHLEGLGADRVVLPQEFETWILEWPGRASFGSSWPGLPADDYAGYHVVDGIQRLEGKNWLGSHPPEVSSLVWRNESPEAAWAPGVLIWKRDWDTTWLVCKCDCEREECERCGQNRSQDDFVEQRFNQLFGKVVVTPKRSLGFNQLEPASSGRPEIAFESWSTYLRALWFQIDYIARRRIDPLRINVEVVQSLWSTGMFPDLGLYYDPGRLDVPAPRWSERKAPEHQGSVFAS